MAKHCILDWYGVALAGSAEPVAKAVREEACLWSSGPCTVIASGSRTGPVAAALANGTASHALDFDDVHKNIGHPTVAIFPAVLAVAEERQSTGLEALRALVAGIEAAALVGAWALPSHYRKGFHTTATIGSFGAAAAAGCLMNLDERQMTMALGLAGTQAAGLKSMFGYMAKPFHAGKAASNGVLAARLAAAGVTAHEDVIAAEQGFIQTLSESSIPPTFEAPGRGINILDTLFKYNASCYLTHSAIEAVRSIRERGVPASSMHSIEIHVGSASLGVCNIEAPSTGLQTKFSLRHTAALSALGYDTAAIDTYSDANAVDPVVVELRKRVSVLGDYKDGSGAHVVVRTADSDIHQEIDVGIPESDMDLQGCRLREKFRSLAAPVLGLARVERLAEAIEGIDLLNDLSSMHAEIAAP
ncbi:MmgE/PrpD family protein [Bradyrhizobium sp. CIR3A]|uniref:MmgE/PrpD family protein n=1 Tax=Bradyrhizobium sp. CIR3A TaxID=2663838 RepID=UPI001605846C|nr:MmgE/PrpD family protein [Bradyrhizobium sp. CIR3A]MBB4260548.1 2-methylcitrate dehydratase PrpD [Bradyrhizobium sp. CIR3A]